MTKDEFKDYLNNLKSKYESDNQKLRETKDPINKRVGIAYNNGCINIIELVLIKLEEVK